IIFSNIIVNKIKEIKDRKEVYYSYINQTISGYSSIKGSKLENYIIKEFKHRNHQYILKKHEFNKLIVCGNLINEFLDMILNIFPIMIGGIYLYNKTIAVSTIITYTYLTGYIFDPIKNISDINTKFKDMKISFIRILEVMGKKNNNNHTLLKKINKIEFKNIHFFYIDAKPVLKNMNLVINDMDKIMIIGKNGSGKSSIMKLLIGFYKQNKGEILFDGINTSNYNENTIRDNILYLKEKEMLLNDSILNNITLKRKISNNLLNKVINICDLKDLINRKSLNHIINEDGSNISGGEKQKIILARSLLLNKKILILDEATNQIDLYKERKILKNILKTYSDRTIIFISHRQSNQDLFQRILKVEKGYVHE
ncbi:MAG TPA: ABC transporter ATP-binding protein, partial [Tenericutes bacterium]|nr:ABC transporter ATP-binding protein [Mycoplasmatota bacterium]